MRTGILADGSHVGTTACALGDPRRCRRRDRRRRRDRLRRFRHPANCAVADVDRFRADGRPDATPKRESTHATAPAQTSDRPDPRRVAVHEHRVRGADEAAARSDRGRHAADVGRAVDRAAAIAAQKRRTARRCADPRLGRDGGQPHRHRLRDPPDHADASAGRGGGHRVEMAGAADRGRETRPRAHADRDHRHQRSGDAVRGPDVRAHARGQNRPGVAESQGRTVPRGQLAVALDDAADPAGGLGLPAASGATHCRRDARRSARRSSARSAWRRSGRGSPRSRSRRRRAAAWPG